MRIHTHQERWRVFFALLLMASWLSGAAMRPIQVATPHGGGLCYRAEGNTDLDLSQWLAQWILVEDTTASPSADDDDDNHTQGIDDDADDYEAHPCLLPAEAWGQLKVYRHQKINPHTPPAAAQARVPRYLLFCCWKNDLA